MIPSTIIDDDTAVRTFKPTRPHHRRHTVLLSFDQFQPSLLDDNLRPWFCCIYLGELHIATTGLFVFNHEAYAIHGSCRNPAVRRFRRFASKRIERRSLHVAVDENILVWLDGRPNG